MKIRRNLRVLLLIASPLGLAGCAEVKCGPRYTAVLERGTGGEVIRTVWLQQCERFTPRIPVSSYEYRIVVAAERPAGKGPNRTGGWMAWGEARTKGWPFREDDVEARADAERRHVWFVARQPSVENKAWVVATLDSRTGQRTGPFDPHPAWASPDSGQVLERLSADKETPKSGKVTTASG